jgi:acyl-CoA thioesterase-1
MRKRSRGGTRARHYPLAQARAWIGGGCVHGAPSVPRRLAVFLLAVLVLALPMLGCPAAEERASERTDGDPIESSPRPQVDARPAIVFLGTSLTAGLGLPESEAYPALIETRLAAAGLDYRVVNAGVSGDTSAGGLRRLDWLLRLPVAVLVVELGANDMLRGQSVEALEANLVAILEKARAAHPEVRFVIEGMRAAPNLGREYGAAFDAVYPRVAERFHAAFVPFLLEDVAARRGLNQADGIHPTAEGHALIAERVWRTLEPVVREIGTNAAR